MRVGLLLALATLLSGTACAKKNACEIPEKLPRPMLEGPTIREPRRLMPTVGYTLALTWVPQRCASRMTNPRDQLQCDGKAAKFGFVLHGLWPEGESGLWPQYCTPTRLVPDKVLREQLCTTPSVQLIQHEWEKHGTCVAKTPDEYFAKGRALYSEVRYPEMEEFSGKTVKVDAFRKAFAAANEGMRPDHLRIKVSRDGWLEEVMVCLDKDFRRQTCPAGQRTAPPEQIVGIR
jgi:ribonuclease T2